MFVAFKHFCSYQVIRLSSRKSVSKYLYLCLRPTVEYDGYSVDCSVRESSVVGLRSHADSRLRRVEVFTDPLSGVRRSDGQLFRQISHLCIEMFSACRAAIDNSVEY